MRRRSKQAKMGRQSAAARNNRSLADEARRSGAIPRHTPPTGAPNDYRRADDPGRRRDT